MALLWQEAKGCKARTKDPGLTVAIAFFIGDRFFHHHTSIARNLGAITVLKAMDDLDDLIEVAPSNSAQTCRIEPPTSVLAMVMISTQVSELALDNFDGQLTQTIVLPNISWQTYQAMLADMGDHRATRIAYNQGILTIKMPSKLHEIINRYFDITSPSTQRLEIYRALGVPEVWRYTKRRSLVIYALQSGSYVEVDMSIAFPTVTHDRLNEFLEQRQSQSENQVIRTVRSWIQQ